MRTKTLLTALAALAAGILTSNAQVYSANVVGYASVATQNGAYTLLVIPFQIGTSNGVNEIWPNASLPDFSQILIWNPNNFTYTTYQSDSGYANGWADVNDNPISSLPTLPVGKGFFLIPSANITNTFSGAIAVNVGNSNKVSLANGAYNLAGGAVPYAGSVTNGNPATGAGGLNMTAAAGWPDFTQLLIWNPNNFTYATYQTDSGYANGWADVNDNPVAAPPTVTVGQGFFIIPSADFNWTVGL